MSVKLSSICYSWKVQSLLLLSVLVGVSSFSCFVPCQSCDLPRNCYYGLVNDTCFCCPVCGLGPGDKCGEEIGFCGRDYECYKNFPDGLTKIEQRQFPGVCRLIASRVTTATFRSSTDEASTPMPPQTTSITASLTTPTAGSLPHATSAAVTLPTGRSTTTMVGSSCRYPACSVEYCTGSSRHRICSAQGLAYMRVAGRGHCQHTSCRACFMYIKPPCTTSCRELPTKPCLKRYYTCVKNYLTDTRILRLTDVTSSHTGRIICYVPEVTST